MIGPAEMTQWLRVRNTVAEDLVQFPEPTIRKPSQPVTVVPRDPLPGELLHIYGTQTHRHRAMHINKNNFTNFS